MKYHIKHTKPIYAIAIITSILSILGLIFNIVKYFNIIKLPKFLGTNIISSFTCIAVIAFVVLTIFFTYLKLNKKELVFKYLFLREKIPYEKIQLIRKDKDSNLMILYYSKIIKKTNKEDICYQLIRINEKLTDSFIDNLKEKNSKISYELFDKEKDKL